MNSLFQSIIYLKPALIPQKYKNENLQNALPWYVLCLLHHKSDAIMVWGDGPKEALTLLLVQRTLPIAELGFSDGCVANLRKVIECGRRGRLHHDGRVPFGFCKGFGVSDEAFEDAGSLAVTSYGDKENVEELTGLWVTSVCEILPLRKQNV